MLLELPEQKNEARCEEGDFEYPAEAVTEEEGEQEEGRSFLRQQNNNTAAFQHLHLDNSCAASSSLSSIFLMISAALILGSFYVHQQHIPSDNNALSHSCNIPAIADSSNNQNSSEKLYFHNPRRQRQQIQNFRDDNTWAESISSNRSRSMILHLDVTSSGGGSVCGWAQTNLATEAGEAWCLTDTIDGMHREHFLTRDEQQQMKHQAALLPECDGNTLRFLSILDRSTAADGTSRQPKQQCLPSWFDLKDASLEFAACDYSNLKDPRLVSMFVMRDPMKRLLAQARSVVHDDDDDDGMRASVLPQDWRNYLSNNPTESNYYTRRLELFSGASSCQCGGSVFKNKGSNVPSRLERAKAVLQEFTILLTLDCLTDGMELLSPYLGWKFAGSHPQFDQKEAQHYSNYHRHDNVEGPLTLPRQQIGDDTVWELLLQQNQLDMQLYQWFQEHATVQC